MIDTSVTDGVTDGVTGGVTEGRVSSSIEKGSWWENWSGDLNNNKIDDNLEWQIAKENLGPEEQILVTVDYDHKPTAIDEQRLISFDWDVIYVYKYIDSIEVEVPVADIEWLATWDDVVMVESAPDYQFTLSSALPSIGVPEVWQKLGYDGEGVTIAIIDTGIDDEHMGLNDLDDNPITDDPKVIAFYDAVNHPNQDDGTYEPYDNHGHGTKCAGIAAGTGAPGYTHIGVAPKAKLVGVKIGSGSIPHDAAVMGVEWAIANKDKFGIDILSNSWGLFIGGPANQNGQSQLSRLMDEAVEAGLVVFVAAGNTAVSLTVYAPADSEKAMAVGSVNDIHELSIFSSQGPTADGRIKPDISAIGENVRSPNANSGTGYGDFSGTSAACPMAAGLAALILQANPDLTPEDVKQILHETSEHNTDVRFPVSPNNGYGWGVVEAYGAVKRSRDLAMTFLNAPSAVHEGDTIRFTSNTTYTRTEFTYRGKDGIRLQGDDELLFQISIPASWSIPTNIIADSVGPMNYEAIPSVPRLENNQWVLEVEFHYTEDVTEPTEATPRVMFNSTTPEVDFDIVYTLYSNITLNDINATRVVKDITVDTQDPPLVFIEDPGDGDSVYGIVTILGTAYDPDVGDEVEEVEIKILDGDWEPVMGTANWEYEWSTIELNNGQYGISARAFDGEEYSYQYNISVNVDNINLPPLAVIDSISPIPANETEEVSFSGHGTDSDGYIVEYEWSSNIDGVLSGANTFSSSSLSIGTHEVSFRVKDNDGVWSGKAQMGLRINQIPIAFIDSISPNPANEGESVTFVGHGSDDRSIVAYNWRSTIDDILSDLASFATATLSLGEHEIYLRVQDDDGKWSEESMQSLRINGIPVAYIDSISPNPVNEGNAVDFAGHGSDDGNIMVYEWTSTIDGLLSESDSFTTSTLSVGEHGIYLRVQDDDDAWSGYAFQNLKINPVPVAFIDSISPNPADEGESVTFTGHGEDVGEIINYNWGSSIDGFIGDTASFTTTDLFPGFHTIFLSVQNDNGVWSEDVFEDLRINSVPTAFIDTIIPNPALEGEDVLFEGHGVDETEIINYSWHSSIDGYLGATSVINTNQLSLGVHNILFKVQDSDYTWSQEVSGSLRVHKRPIAYIDGISPDPATEGVDVTFVGHGTDDSVITAYEWLSSVHGLLSDQSEFSRSNLSIGEHDISFRVMDDVGEWSEYASSSLRINQVPIAFIDSIAPNPANEDESVTLTGHGSDDRDIAGYSWQSSIDGLLSMTATYSSSHLSIGEHNISFTVKDDDGLWSEAVTLHLRINQIPMAYIDSVSPNHVNEGESVTFIGRGVDDGNIVVYHWYSSIDGDIGDEREFTRANLSIGDHVITLTVMDDYNNWSNEARANLRINQIPIAYIDSISPSPALNDNSIYFVGHGVDDETIDEYHWNSSLDGYLGSSESLSWVGLSIGEHVISFKVRDQDEIWSEEEHFVLKVHKKPIARITSISPSSPNEDDVILLSGEGIDDGVIMAYNWTSNLDGFLGGQNEFETVLSVGKHTISLTVQDDVGVWSRPFIKKVDINGIPLAFIDSLSPNPATEGEIVTLRGHGVDDGNVVAYQWRSSIEEELGSDSLLSISGLSVGVHEIYFKVKDNWGVWSSEDSVSLVIEGRINQAPIISITTPGEGDVFSDMILIQAEALDEDGQVERIEARVDDTGWFTISDSYLAYYTLEINDLAEGEHVIYVRAYDGEEYSEEQFVIIRLDFGGNEGEFLAANDLMLISFVLVIIGIVAGVILYFLIAGRKRRNRGFIRL